MQTIAIGKLSKRITIKKFIDVEDAMGQSKKVLTDAMTIWADLYPVRGAELYEIKKLQSKVTHKCYTRYFDGIDINCYISYKGDLYTIEDVIDVNMERKKLEIRCALYSNKEVVPSE